MEDWHPCSHILSHILDHMGYCAWIINARKYISREKCRKLQTASDTGLKVLIAGSRREGLSNRYQVDSDYLVFLDDICGTVETIDCVTGDQLEEPTRYMFRIDRDWSPPGYCMLVLASRPTQSIRSESIERSLSVLDRGEICLNSESYLRIGCKSNLQDVMTSEQLAELFPPTAIMGCTNNDILPTFSCPCSPELKAWYERPRHHDWPSQSLQQDIISAPANLVAIGSKDSILGRMEWRFCFNEAEIKLMDSLNHTQTNVYVVLKMIAKDYLKPENKEITPYVVKNIVFWMCETNPSSLFIPSTLLSWIYEGLRTLKSHIETGNLPYYMIPARNLLHAKFVDDVKKTAFLEKLSKLLESGPSLVHECVTIKLGLEMYNNGLLENYGWKRNLVEVFTFPKDFIPNNVKVRLELLCLAGIAHPMITVLFPDLEDLIAQGLTQDEIVTLANYRIGIFLNHELAADLANST